MPIKNKHMFYIVIAAIIITAVVLAAILRKQGYTQSVFTKL